MVFDGPPRPEVIDLGACCQAGLGGNVLGVNVYSPDFNPVDWWHAAENFFTPGPANVLISTLTQEQKDALVQQHTADLVKAGMDSQDAATWAESDITTMLMANNADPSQSGVPIWQWFALGGAALVALLILTR